ncbi:hypothetical protein HPB50_019808 [Hyalomma asiaticum]|uniref:Uncharacterized protein n=1 Tax=Hyalomma asiaticum TaxID=266040 RepID=A0ACB7RYM8_HYAAI|nr:hypothetical protein HPB50_019808 [Hyalomma asiaticum]
MGDTFVNTIVNFSTDNITDDIRNKMKTKYLNNPEFNFEKVNRASLACGPMVKWAIAQINFADMLKRVEPLRNELASLEAEADSNKHNAEEIDSVIVQLEKSIASYKEEYANLVSQAQAIKTDLANVQAKVDRSIALLSSLSSEKQRWEDTSETFKNQMSTISGDVLLGSAFLAYAGYFDQQYRQNLFNNWCAHLQQAGIHFRLDLARTEYLSTADERLRWQANALPTDDLCTENAIMLKRFNRYPLIIDPSGQATKYILNEFRERKITKTSFLDDSFRKNLESALRFGNPLLVQDVESYDPILNPVLNREVRKTGGRVLITLGDQDIDLSPTFCIFLSTRDPTVEFPPDLCSRVTFVNFTVTRSSLQSQCLNQVLKAEREDIDEKRSDLLKLQGEFHVRLRQLEKSLLQALNDSKGRILDDDSVISTLEKLKNEAAEISRKVEETDKVMAEVEAVSLQYQPLAQACSSIFFTLEGLHQAHFLYQYSLHFFLEIYNDVLTNNSHLTGIVDHTARLGIITKDLFQVVYTRVTRGMLHEDKLVFALLLCRIHLRGFSQETNFEHELNHLLRGKEGILPGQPTIHVAGLSPDQLEGATALSRLPAFRNLQQRLDDHPDFLGWVESTAPERDVPVLWEEGSRPLTPVGQAMHQLLVIQAFRPDRVIAQGHQVVTAVLGNDFTSASETELDLAAVVDNEVKAGTPILMCSVPGYDASGRVDDLAAELGRNITSLAMGSAEGFSQAEKAINAASKNGRWVMLKNVHLAPQWLVQLEKKLHALQPHPAFRLFLTLEVHPKVPVNLLRAGRVFLFEPPPGIRANLLRTFSTVPAQRMMKAPGERARLYFLLAWFHAIVQERLRYVPLGWAKHYEFNESDLRVACDTLDTWIDTIAMGRTNLPPEKVPWNALRILFGQCIYGGKIDNDFDQRLLNSFLSKLFTAKSFEPDFMLIEPNAGDSLDKGIASPEGIRRDQFLHWVESLTERQTPSWLGLPNNAEKVLLTNRGSDLIAKLLKMQLLEDDDEPAYVAAEEGERAAPGDGRPAWMATLQQSGSTWLRLLPPSLQSLRRTKDNIGDPLYRCLEREVNVGSKLLKVVRSDLEDMVRICRGERRQTNYHRTMIADLAKGMLPAHWKKYTVSPGCTVIQWVTDFSDRIKQLQRVSQACTSGGAAALKSLHIWLGGMFNPEAYITATRQYVAQANGWSLEELSLEVRVSDADEKPAPVDEYSFALAGLKLQGAKCVQSRLSLTSTIFTELPLTTIRWVKYREDDAGQAMVTLPVYLNSSRTELLFTVDLPAADPRESHSFYERGVALLCSTTLG